VTARTTRARAGKRAPARKKAGSAPQAPAPKKPKKAGRPGKKAPAARPLALARVRSPAPTALQTADDDALEPRLPDASAMSSEALGRLRGLETLEDGYQAWVELRGLHQRAQSAYAAETDRIEGQGEFLLGAVRAARDFAAPGTAEGALAKAGEVDAFIARTTGRLDGARKKLKLAVESSESRWAGALAEARATVISRVERTVKHARPALRLLLRALAQNRRILHLERLSGDAPVLAHAVLAGAVPSRYDFLFDDATDDVSQAPAALYAEEGVAAAEVRCSPRRQLELLQAASGVFPSKGMIPFQVPQPAATLHVRFLQRGPVAEAEVADGEGWRSVLSVEEAEVIAGWLIKLQLEGKLSVSLARG
jgi:hypothetical protein